MKQFIAVILFTLFNLGAFGVTIEKHLCCHSQEENTTNHCKDDRNCCGDNDDCCNEIVSQIKIAKNYNSNDLKISFEFSKIISPVSSKFYSVYVAPLVEKQLSYSLHGYLPPPQDLHIVYSSFLI